MGFQPLHERVLVKRLEEQEKTVCGIIIPDTARGKATEARVIAADPDARDKGGKMLPMAVDVGDRVVLARWSGTEVNIADEELLIVKDDDVLGVVEAQKSSARVA